MNDEKAAELTIGATARLSRYIICTKSSKLPKTRKTTRNHSRFYSLSAQTCTFSPFHWCSKRGK